MKTLLQKSLAILVLCFAFASVKAGFIPIVSATSSCTGNDATVIIGGSGVPGPYTIYLNVNGNIYFDSSVAVADTFTGLSAGTYGFYIYVTGDTGYFTPGTVTVPSVISINAAVINTTCPNNQGAINASVSGGTSPYNYLWNTGATTTGITNLAGGAYTLTVNDAGGCTAVLDTNVIATSNLHVWIYNTGLTVCSPTLTALDTGGPGPDTYLWSTGATTQNLTLSNINYYVYAVTVTDANGCTGMQSDTIATTLLMIDSSSQYVYQPGSCNSDNGRITVVMDNGTSPFTFNWSNGSTDSIATGLQPGQYSVTVTDANGCTGTQTWNLGQNYFTAYISVISYPTCSDTDGALSCYTYGGNPPYTYLWSGGSTAISISDLTVGTYSVSVTDVNGCSATANYYLNSAPLSLDSSSQYVVYPSGCNGSGGSITAVMDDGTPPFTYVWSNGSTDSVISNLTAGQYTVVVTDANGCTGSSTWYLSQDYLSVYIIINNYPSCSDSDGSLGLYEYGGNAPYSYQWSNGSTDSVLVNLPSGDYSVTVTDAGGCTATTYDSLVPAPLQIDSATTAIILPGCSGGLGSISIRMSDGVPPFSYLWSNGATDSAITGLTAGDYSVTVTDAHGCSGSGTYYIYVNDVSAYIYLLNEPACTYSNGSIAVAASGGSGTYHYQWADGDTSSVLQNIPAGEYALTVTDYSGCSASSTYYLNSIPLLIDSLNTTVDDPGCQGIGGLISVAMEDGTRPFTYLWSTGANDSIISGLAAGDYGVSVTDANGCTGSNEYYLTDGYQVTAYISDYTNPACGSSNGSILALAYQSNNYGGLFTYAWSNGHTGESTQNLAAGYYTVTATDTSGCSATVAQTLTGLGNFTVSTTVTPTSCDTLLATGTATAVITGSGTPPYSFDWYSFQSGQLLLIGTGQTISNLSANSYPFVVAFDAIGCTAQDTAQAYIPFDPSCYDHITGYAYNDTNNNCTYDAGETGAVLPYITATNANGQTYYASTDSTGYYDLEVFPGTYNVTVNLYSYGYCSNNACVSSYTDTFSTTGQVSTGNNFGITGGLFDLAVSIGDQGSAPGQERKYWVYYYNLGISAVDSGVLTFVHDPNITLVSTTPPYTTYNAATYTITWNLVDALQPMTWFGEQNNVTMEFQIPSTLPLGTQLSAYAQITPLTGDCDTFNNTELLIDSISSSHDPNEKTVTPAGNLSATDTLLNYTIRFQNTGNAAATLVVISDTLSPNVNPATVKPGASSSPYTFKLSGNGVLTFTLAPIYLTDSTENVDSSKGFVNYSVLTKNDLPPGAEISNTAYVYFDANAAVVTNTTTNVRSNSAGISNLNKGAMAAQVYPNPAHDEARIEFTGATGTITLKLTDALGNAISNNHSNETYYILDASRLASGIYFYSAQDEAGNTVSGKISVVH